MAKKQASKSDHTAKAVAARYGFSRLEEPALLFGCSVTALRNWHRENPQRYEIVLMGCREYKKTYHIG